MAIVKIHPRPNASNRIRYVFAQQVPGDPADSEKCTPEADIAIAEFKAIRDLHPNSRRKNEAYEIYQSWSPEESKQLTREEVNRMGRELVEDYFKGHQFLVVTHSNRAHLHNHIIVNAVHMETGRSIPNERGHLYRLREINDKICLARGLSIPNKDAISRESHMPDKVQRMKKFKGHSYVLDMMEKADFARKYATSYDQYKAILLEFGIGARIEEKNITYFYPGQTRGKRGSKMGKPYNKAFLEKTFKENDELFAKHPLPQAELANGISAMRACKGESLKLPKATTVQEKDYGAFTKTRREDGPHVYPSDEAIKDSIIPMDEFKRARRVSIIDYCTRNQIALTKNKKGETVLKGREHAVISDHEWINARNKTRGTIIEFVAAHYNTTFLGAVAKINNNPRLLLLEQYYGEKKREYTSFHIPKHDRMDANKSVEHLGRFLQSFGARQNFAGTLLNDERVHIEKSGIIRFLSGHSATGALEFTPKPDGSWSSRKLGTYSQPFISKQGSSKRVVVFFDPLEALKHLGDRLFSNRKEQDGYLILFEPNQKHIDIFLASNPHTKQISLWQPPDKKDKEVELDFFNILKKRYAHLDINFSLVNSERSLSRDGRELSL